MLYVKIRYFIKEINKNKINISDLKINPPEI